MMEFFTQPLSDNISLPFRQANEYIYQPEDERTSLSGRSSDCSLLGSGSTTVIPSYQALTQDTVVNQQRQSEPRQPSDIDWERIRPEFTRLYLVNRMKLKEIMVMMRTKYDFDATENMYKKRITRWCLGKSFTYDEKANYAALAQRCRTEGKPLPTRDEYGREIPWVKVRRQVGSRMISKDMVRNTTRTNGYNPQIRGQYIDHKDNSTIRSAVQNQTPQLIQPLIPADVRRLNSMLYHISSLSVWQRSTRASSTRLSRLSEAYEKAMTLVTISPATVNQAFLAAAKKTSQMLPQPGWDTLLVLFDLIVSWSRFLETAYFLSAVQSLAKLYLQEYGSYNPLVLFMKQLLDSMKLSVMRGKCARHILDQCHFTKLIEHLQQECPTTKAEIGLGPKDISIKRLKCINLLVSAAESVSAHANDATATLRLAESSCHDLIAWSIESFGNLNSRTLRAKISLGRIYQRQGRFEESHSVLEPIWKLWYQMLRSHGQASAAPATNWHPGWGLALICEKQDDFAQYQFYSQETIRVHLFERGPLDTFVLLNLQILLDFHVRRGNYGAFRYLEGLYPDLCAQILKLYKWDASNNATLWAKLNEISGKL